MREGDGERRKKSADESRPSTRPSTRPRSSRTPAPRQTRPCELSRMHGTRNGLTARGTTTSRTKLIKRLSVRFDRSRARSSRVSRDARESQFARELTMFPMAMPRPLPPSSSSSPASHPPTIVASYPSWPLARPGPGHVKSSQVKPSQAPRQVREYRARPSREEGQ
jgi:hypothetical protein